MVGFPFADGHHFWVRNGCDQMSKRGERGMWPPGEAQRKITCVARIDVQSKNKNIIFAFAMAPVTDWFYWDAQRFATINLQITCI